ncbi:ATP-binding protein [Pseudomonadota bacterium]
MHIIKAGKTPLKSNIARLLAIVLCTIWALIGYAVNHLYNDRLETATVVAQNMVRSLAAHTETSFALVRFQLNEAANALDNIGPQPIMSEEITRMLGDRVETLPALLSLVVVDANANIVQAAISDQKGGYLKIKSINVADREYFRSFASASNLDPASFFIGRPIQGRVNKAWFIPVSRPRINPDGSFAGVILGTIKLEAFGNLYKSFDLPADASVALARKDGVFLARTPFKKMFFERTFEDNPFFKDILPAEADGIYLERSSIDDRNRIITYQSLNLLPLVLVMTQTKESIVTDWMRDSTVAVFVGILSTLILIFYAWSLWQHADTIIKQRNSLEAKVGERTKELQKSNEELQSNIADLDSAKNALEKQAADLIELAENESMLSEQLRYEVGVKNRFFSIISHDLKSPFTTLLGMTKMMAQMSEKFTKDKLVSYAGDVNEAGERVFELLQNLLEWSRLQMDGGKMEPEILALDEVIRESIDLLKPIALEKGVTLTNDVHKQVAHANLDMVRTVVRNLITNALKFTPPGGMVDVSSVKANGQVQVTVADNGVGIKANLIEGIFAIDQKVSTTGTAGEKGTGLGLPLCKDMLESNGGRIWVESTEGKGSKFHFTLPTDANTT